MIPKFAILLDGGFLLARLRERLRKAPTADDVVVEAARLRRSPQLDGLRLMRIYWYDAPPATRRIRNPLDDSELDLGSTERFASARALHGALELTPDVAVRMGELAFRRWQLRPRTLAALREEARPIRAEDIQPRLEQKGVDLRIGLDIARLSLRGMVDTLVVVTGDSDLIPAFKFARREGVRVLLDPLGAPVRRELKAHADAVLTTG